MEAYALEVAIILGCRLVSMHLALRAVHVGNNSLCPSISQCSRQPQSVDSLKCASVHVMRQNLGLKASHRAFRRSFLAHCLPAYNRPHRRVTSKLVCVDDVRISRKPTVYRLPEKLNQMMPNVLPCSGVREVFGCHRSQSQSIIQLTVCQKSRIGCDLVAHKLQPNSQPRNPASDHRFSLHPSGVSYIPVVEPTQAADSRSLY